MKILLISANTETINMPVLPLGMAFIAASVRNAGHEVCLINLMGQADVFKAIEDAVTDFSPDVTGISVRNIDDQAMISPKFMLEPVKSMIARIRTLTESPIVIGGPGYSIFPQSALDYLGADFGIRGEGELTFVMFLEHIENTLDPSQISGVYLPGKPYQERGKRKPVRLDLLPIPVPGIHLKSHYTDTAQQVWIPFQTGRGCPMGCTYCSVASIDGTFTRKQNVNLVVNALSEYAKAGFDHIYFVDNIFNAPVSYAVKLCRKIIDAGLNIKWKGIFYPWRPDEELIRLMAESGCCEVSLGFESGSPVILKNMNKKYSLDEVRKASEMLRKYNISHTGFLMLGAPGETRETVLKSFDFADSLPTDKTRVTAGIRIYPDTELARQAIHEGMIRPDDSLLFPTFYIPEKLKEWLLNTVNEKLAERPGWFR